MSLPVKPLSTVDPHWIIPVPLYFAGFPVSAHWAYSLAGRLSDSMGFNDIEIEVVSRWHDMGEPEPFMAPRFCRSVTGDYIIYFLSITGTEPEMHRSELEYFYKHRDGILARAMDLLRLTEDEKELVKTKLFKWHRHMKTKKREPALGEGECLMWTPPIRSSEGPVGTSALAD
ncbi:hypothetical protein CC1G_07238 [Coprinopsis cinerea okayama7|uniref:Uncharacterized protein n=1 Tax=Coprinopsis cinerea (strain Okayama-7 / 130 / ATCC MYA-4618 / FGSC 9003) TaxID=240176 RepID=A8PD18_COPC7|nr:hypothetical protein CC1G_07238 [Coprinopsis cinerea okayama7\|eukprot:XP_001840508.1 hypothetical protein CC1G_07238 [Coprinopsis cinerea okayama7\